MIQRQTKAEIAAQLENIEAEKRRIAARPWSESIGNYARAWWHCFFDNDIVTMWPLIPIALFILIVLSYKSGYAVY